MQASFCKITRIVKRYISVLFLYNCQHTFIYCVFYYPPRGLYQHRQIRISLVVLRVVLLNSPLLFF